MQELILPAQYPMGLLRLRAIAHLTTITDGAVRRETMAARSLVVLQAIMLMLLVAVQVLHIATVGEWLHVAQAGMLAGMLAAGDFARQRAQSLKQECAVEIARIQDRSLCPLEVLNARFESAEQETTTAEPQAPPAQTEVEQVLLSSFQRAAGLTLPRRAATR